MAGLVVVLDSPREIKEARRAKRFDDDLSLEGARSSLGTRVMELDSYLSLKLESSPICEKEGKYAFFFH